MDHAGARRNQRRATPRAGEIARAVISANLAKLEQMLPDDALVLDVGGYISPLSRADWVIDVMPYDSRGPHGREGTGPERFSEDTWVQRDICDPEPWPFEDDQF